MATDTVDQRRAHLRGLGVTMLACVAGILAAVVSTAFAEGATDVIGVYVLVGAIMVQLPLLRLAGVDVEDFSTKDYLYITFMTFSLWFVSWGVLLTANSTLPF